MQAGVTSGFLLPSAQNARTLARNGEARRAGGRHGARGRCPVQPCGSKRLAARFLRTLSAGETTPFMAM